MNQSSKKEQLKALKQRLSAKYGFIGAVIGTAIIFFGVFIVPFSAVACINCAIPLVAALGLAGTVVGLAGKNTIIVIIGLFFLAASGYILLFKKYGNNTCAVKVKKNKK